MRNSPHVYGLCLGTFLCLSTVLVTGCSKPKPQTDPQPVDSSANAQELIQKYKSSTTNVVVDVDGTTLSQADLDTHVARMMAANQAGGIPPAMQAGAIQEISRQVIDRFVMQTVLLNEAKRQNATVTEAERAKALDEIKASIPNGMTLDEALKSFGMSEAQLQEDLSNDLRIRKMLDSQVAGVATATDADAEKFYKESSQFFAVPESVKARHILVKCAENAAEDVQKEKKKKADDLRAKLVDGADFAALAQKESDCPSSKDGGELGQLTRGRTVKEFEDAAFAQKLNEIGPVVKSEFGYHIIQISARDEARTRPFAEVKTEILTFLNNESKEKVISKYVEGLRSKARVKYSPKWEPSAAPEMPMGMPSMPPGAMMQE